MIEKVVKKARMTDINSVVDDLNYWLSKSAEERVSTVEILRRQDHGSSARLQRVVKITKFK